LRYTASMGSRCRVSYADAEGIHSVEVNADTLYEAVAMAVAEFRQDSTVSNQPGAMTEIHLRCSPTARRAHIRLQQVLKWSEPQQGKGQRGLRNGREFANRSVPVLNMPSSIKRLKDEI